MLIRRDCIVNGTSLEHERWKRAHTDGLPEDGDQVSPAAKTAHTTHDGGMFSADPAMGFPAGAPEGYPEHITTHGMIHAFAPPLSFLSLIAA